MAIMTGTNLLDSIIESTGAVINPVQRAGLIARVDQMIAAGTASKMALAAVVLNFSTDMRSKVTAAELIDGIEQNQTLIENAADDAAVDAIDFPPFGEPEAGTLAIADVTVSENGGKAVFTVTLTGDAPAAGESVTVDFATADGTAVDGTDYTAKTGTLTFGEGETTKTIEVDIADNQDADGDKAFTVELTNAAGTIGGEAVTIADGEATATIQDDDGLSLQSTTPEDNGSTASVSADLTMTFDDNVQVGTGNIQIFRASDNALVETIDVTNNSQVSITGNNVVINPAHNLEYDTEYYVKMDAGTLVNGDGHEFAGLSNETDWNFTTVGKGTTYVLTPGVDVETASLFLASQTYYSVDGKGPTLQAGDVLTGTEGRTDNTLVVTDLTSGVQNNNIPAGVELENIQTVKLDTTANTSAAGFDTSSFLDVELLDAITQGVTGQDIFIAQNGVNGQTVTVEQNGVAGKAGVVVQGGHDVTVDSRGGAGVIVGNRSTGTLPDTEQVTTGDVEVNQLSTGAGGVNVFGGTTVDVTVVSSSNSGAVEIGNTSVNTGNSTSGEYTNPSGEVKVSQAGTGDVEVFGGTDVEIENTALAGAGTIVVGDASNTIASNLPTGNVVISEEAEVLYDGLAGSGNNDTQSGSIEVYGGNNVTIDTNAANYINIGNLGKSDETALNPAGNIFVTNTGIVNSKADVGTDGSKGTVTITGGKVVDVTTTGADVSIGRNANPSADEASNPTGNVTVTETMNGSGFVRTVEIDGGVDVTVNAKGQNVVIGKSEASAPTGKVVVNQADVFTGNNNFANSTNEGDVEVFGGTDVDVNTTGGHVTVGGVVGAANAVPSGAVSIDNTFGGVSADKVVVKGGTTVDIHTSQTSGDILLGKGSDALNATGTALKAPELAATGDVTIVNATVNGKSATYGTGGDVVVHTNGGETVSITGGDVDSVKDIQSVLQTGGSNTGKAVGTSTLKTVILDGETGTDGIAVQSDALANLSVLNHNGAETITVTNNTKDHDLTITQGGNSGGKNTLQVVDAKAKNITVTDNGTASSEILRVDAAKAKTLTVDNAASARLNVGAVATDLETVTLKGAGNTAFEGAVFGTGNLNKVKAVDASAATGNVTLALQPLTVADTAQSYLGGSAVDTVTVNTNVSKWGNLVSVNGGAGDADVLVADYDAAGTDAAMGNASNVKGFEILRLGSTASNGGNYDAAGFSEVQLGGVAGNIAITNAAANGTLSLLSDTTGGKTVSFTGSNTTGTSNNATVNLGSGMQNISAAGTGAITLDGIETVNVNSMGGMKGNVATINNISTTGTSKFVITGDRALTLTSPSGGVSEIDASAAKAKVDVSNVDLSNAGVTLTGGKGMLTAEGSNDSGNFSALVALSDADTLAAAETVTVEIDGTTFVYAVAAGKTASVSNAASAIADLINAQTGTGSTVANTNGTATQTGANVLAANAATASGGNIVLNHNAAFGLQTSETGTNTTITDSILGGQQQTEITVTTACSEAGDTLSVDINGTTVTYTATGADAAVDNTAENFAAAIGKANVSGVASAVADGAKILITSQAGQINHIDNIAATDAGDATTPAANISGAAFNMATVSNLVTAGEGGVDYTLGLGGSWDATSMAFSAGSETVNLAASNAVVDTIQAKNGAVSTFNGATGGITGFVVDSQSASDVIKFGAPKTIVKNATTQTVNTVGEANTMANTLDPSGSLFTKLANLTFSISNGVITFGATGGHSLDEFTSGELMSAAQIIVSSSTSGGADNVAAFSSKGKSYVVASDAAVATELRDGTGNKSTLIELKDVADVKGFGKTFGEATVVSSNVTNITDAADDLAALAQSSTLDYTGFAVATLNVAGTAAKNTNTTIFNNLAASALLDIDGTAANNDHMGLLQTTQVGASGHNSLTVDMGTNASVVDGLTVNGAAQVDFVAAAGAQEVTSLTDATNTLNTITASGATAFTLVEVDGSALKNVNSTGAAGGFNFGDATHIDDHAGLTFKLAGASASAIYTSGADNTFEQSKGVGVVTLNASGANNTIKLSNGANSVTAHGAGNTIKVGTGANTINATGSDDVFTIASSAADGVTTVTVGTNATVNIGSKGQVVNSADDVKVGQAVTGGTSADFAATTINFIGAEQEVKIDFSNGTIGAAATTLLGVSVANSQVNVAGAASLEEALDLAANYTLLTQGQGTAPSTADLAANTAKIDWFQYDGNTYIVAMQNDTAAAVQQTGLDDNDIVVKLTGLVDLTGDAYLAGVLTIA